MDRIYLTSPVEPMLKAIGVPETDIPDIGGEIVANLAEFVTGIFSKGWFNKFIQFLAGLIATGYAVWGRPDTRLRKELLHFGIHELLRIIQLSPGEAQAIQESIVEFTNALKTGDVNAVLASIVRAPDEIKTSLETIASALGIPVQEAIGGAKASVSEEVVPKTSGSVEGGTSFLVS